MTSLAEAFDAAVVAHGVVAQVFDEGDRGIYIPVILAEQRGNGDIGRYLDSLPTNRRIVFPTVISNRLMGMLERRGYVIELEWSTEMREWVECFIRAPKSEEAR